MTTGSIHQGLKELRLPTIKKRFEEVACKALNEKVTYEQFLSWLIEEELIDRREKRISRKLTESRIPTTKIWENFDFKKLPLKLSQQFKGLLGGEFIKQKENLLLFGSPGGGKTHLLCALGRELISRHDFNIMFVPSSKLVQDLLVAKRDLTLSKAIKRLTALDGLIIDDIGYVQQSKDEMDVMFTLISECYERTSILLTSNLPFSKWETIFKDPMMTVAAIDRLVHHSVIFEVKVPSYRAEASKEKHQKNNQ